HIFDLDVDHNLWYNGSTDLPCDERSSFGIPPTVDSVRTWFRPVPTLRVCIADNTHSGLLSHRIFSGSNPRRWFRLRFRIRRLSRGMEHGQSSRWIDRREWSPQVETDGVDAFSVELCNLECLSAGVCLMRL